MPVRIELSGVRRAYQADRPAVADLDLDIAPGELCVLVGPSGCGKSTTLRCIAGLEPVDAGEIRFDGRPVQDLDPRARDVAMVFQNYALYPHMSVARNIGFPLRMRRQPRAEVAAAVARVADLLELRPLLDRRPRQLSGGQQQRVALARALVRDPAVFLFDEPLSNLDARLRNELRREIGGLHARLETTMVYVTHDQAEAMVLADRLAVLESGHLQQVGPPAALFDRPANTFVARFLGSPPMNLLDAVVADGALQVEGAAGGLRSAGLPEGPLQVGIRPHRVVPAAADVRGALRFDARVETVEALGHETLLHLRVDDDATMVAQLPGRAEARPGDRIAVQALPADLRFFDARGQALRHASG